MIWACDECMMFFEDKDIDDMCQCPICSFEVTLTEEEE